MNSFSFNPVSSGMNNSVEGLGNLLGYFSPKSVITFRYLFLGSTAVHASETDNRDGSIPTLEMGNGGTERVTTTGGLRHVV